MPVKNTNKKTNTYVYTEADLGEGLLHAGVSHVYWIGKEMNTKMKSITNSAQITQQNSAQSNYCF